jgi:hypothetical protein
MSTRNSTRNKPHRQQRLRVPVTAELQKELMFAAHGALTGLRLAPSKPAFDQLGGIFNVVYVAMCNADRKSPVLESGMRALQDVARRCDTKGVLAIGRFELPPIENAVLECEALVTSLDVLGLHAASEQLRKMEQAPATHRELEPA